MHATELSPLSCIFTENFSMSQKPKIMKNGSKSDHLVFTLEDDISDQVLKSKTDKDTTTGSSSVALWIKSLKEANVSCDDSSQDSLGHTGSSSDQDDLQLGAEANDLRLLKNRRSYKYSSLNRDSDSDSSYNRWCSWTGRRSFLTNLLSYDRSVDSDTSGLSSVTSVSSLLTARESDPEDVLKGLGFRGPTVLDKIPDRFINTGTICEGVDSEQFLYNMQGDADDVVHSNPDIPPWVMVRFDDIPRTFWTPKDDGLESTDTGEAQPLNNESQPDDIRDEEPARPPKTFPSKFGTYLEPVTEEVELSSQGSSYSSPMTKLSFESNRSTLKASSQDSLSQDNVSKIPSLSDLWQAAENGGKLKSYDDANVVNDYGNSTSVGNISGVVDNGYNGDWIDKSRESYSNDLCSSMPSVADVVKTTGENSLVSPWATTHQQTENSPVNPWSTTPAIPDIDGTARDDIPPVIYNPWSSSSLEKDAVPALSAYRDNNDTLLSKEEATRDLSDDYSSTNANITVDPQTNFTKTKYPLLSIPTVTISEAGEKSRKLSTVIAPDLDKLMPVKSGESRKNNKRNGKCSLNASEAKSRQFNLYGTQQWLAHENKVQTQVQFSTKGRLKSTRRSLMRSKKTANIKMCVSVSQYRKVKQVTLPCEKYDRNIPCFSKFDMESYGTGKISKTGIQLSGRTFKNFDEFETCEKQARACMSLPLEETVHRFEVQSETGMRDGCIKLACGSKNDGYSPEIECSRTKIGVKIEVHLIGQRYASGNHNLNLPNNKVRPVDQLLQRKLKEELDDIQNSLKGVKMYKAGIHLMQLASCVETVMCSEKLPTRVQQKSSERLLDSIQDELNHLEKYILRLQKQLKGMFPKEDNHGNEESKEDVHRRGSDFSDITRQLLQEQLKMFNSISSAAVSPASTPSISRKLSQCSETPDVLRHTDVVKLKKEIQQLRQDSVEQNASMKEEILSEVRDEIRKCFKEFMQR